MHKAVAAIFTLIVMMILAVKVELVVYASDQTDDGLGLPYDSFADRMQAGWTWPMVLIAVALTLALAVASYFALSVPADTAEPTDDRSSAPPTEITLSSQAADAKARVQGLIARVSHMPAEAFDLTTRNEFDAIRERHLPDLDQAHRDARETVENGTAEASAIDADYAASLDRLAGTLNKLAEECSGRARADLTVQYRFIETRHPAPSDPLPLDI